MKGVLFLLGVQAPLATNWSRGHWQTDGTPTQMELIMAHWVASIQRTPLSASVKC